MGNSKTVYLSMNVSIIAQIITGIVAIRGLFEELKPTDSILKSILGFEMGVQAVELLFYIFLIRKMKIVDMAMVRYFDWVITTPVMLITSIIYYKYEEYIEKFENTKSDIDRKRLEDMSFIGFINENRGDVIKIVIFNLFMLIFGYLGETGVIDKMTGFYLGTIAFFMSFYIIYENYAKKSKKGKQLFTILFIVWSIYGIAYLLNPMYKNTVFNGLDVVAKNFFGLYLYYKIIESKTEV